MIVEFTGKRRHNPTVKPAEMYAQQECPEEMIWDICSWIRTAKGGDTNCYGCPRWEEHEHHGKVQQGCFLLAHETCRVALAWQKRLTQEKENG